MRLPEPRKNLYVGVIHREEEGKIVEALVSLELEDFNGQKITFYMEPDDELDNFIEGLKRAKKRAIEMTGKEVTDELAAN